MTQTSPQPSSRPSPSSSPGSSSDASPGPSSGAARARVGVIGLAVMGSNLARNFARHGHTVAVLNRTRARTDELLAAHGHEGDFVPAFSIEEFVAALERPRRALIMVKAGAPTDAMIDALVPHLEPGDIVVDGGNAHFEDTRRREARLREVGLHFVGAGISGGEEGALNGPSIMPGGSPESYRALGPLLEDIAATVDGEPCCTYIGPDGAGHFVKMVHNGIEYADMQFIAEAYDVLRGAGLSAAEIAEAFRTWNTGDLDSFLIEITAEVLSAVDARTGRPLVEVIADAAEQKGTGRWTVQTALELGVPVSTIAEAVFARSTSGHTRLREAARSALSPPARDALPETVPAVSSVGRAAVTMLDRGGDLSGDGPSGEDVRGDGLSGGDRERLVEDVRAALWCSKVVAYAQGLDQIRAGSEAYGWDIDVAGVATIWRGGCIIRARLLERIRAEYAAQHLTTLLAAPGVAAELTASQARWRSVVSRAVLAGTPVPGFAAALAYYDTVRAQRLPAALVQGLRDLFGAHTYRRVDVEGSFHTDWSGDHAEHPVS